jgi:Restriction endonuclease
VANLLVQCKLWKVQPIRVDTIRSLHSVIVTEHATGGIVVSCGTFTNDAASLANAVGSALTVQRCSLSSRVCTPACQAT